MLRILLFTVALFLSAIRFFGQLDSCWTVVIIKKGKTPDFSKNMYGDFDPDGFYLYRNCIYEFDLKSKQRIGGRLIDIKKDTLLFTNLFNENVAFKAKIKLDTLKVHYRQLDKLNLIADRALGWYNKYSMDNFDFYFRKDTTHRVIRSEWVKIYSNDDEKYEVVPHLTAQGMSSLFEEGGRTYYYLGSGMTKPDRSKMDDTYDKKNGIVFTPCKVEEIRGLAIGLKTRNEKNRIFNERDSLVLHGVALQLNPFEIFGLINPRFTGPLPDSVDFYFEQLKNDWNVKLYGVNISLVNTIHEMELRGVNITPLITMVDEIHGTSISGLSNFCYVLKGLSIAGIRNRAMIARGIQIGLFNKATDLRGFQIGLWNKNGRRSLPFINWQFKPGEKK